MINFASRKRLSGQQPSESLAVDIREAARLMGVGSGTVAGMCRSGELPSIVIGPRHRRILRSSIQEFLSGRLAEAMKSA